LSNKTLNSDLILLRIELQELMTSRSVKKVHFILAPATIQPLKAQRHNSPPFHFHLKEGILLYFTLPFGTNGTLITSNLVPSRLFSSPRCWRQDPTSSRSDLIMTSVLGTKHGTFVDKTRNSFLDYDFSTGLIRLRIELRELMTSCSVKEGTLYFGTCNNRSLKGTTA
jgi:hypothetical protein